MRSTITVVMFTLVFAASSFAQTSTSTIKVTPVTLRANSTVGEVTGNIKSGGVLSSLRWAEQSNVACFPGTRFEMFNGNHVFYRIAMPAASSLKVTVTPKNNAQISLYALRQGTRPTDQGVPPNVSAAISCEASYPIYANLPGGRTVKNKDDGTRTVEYISVGSAYSVLIGIAGARGAIDGEFTMTVQLNSR